jgi:hypothetical protein
MKNLFSPILLIAATELALVAWFLYGQGYDRVSAQVVIWVALMLVPLITVGLTFSRSFRNLTHRTFGEAKNGWVLYARTLLLYSAVLLIGVGLPALLVFVLILPKSPFEELWWLVGGIAVMLGGTLYLIYQPATSRHWFALGYLTGVSAILWATKALVFSVF